MAFKVQAETYIPLDPYLGVRPRPADIGSQATEYYRELDVGFDHDQFVSLLYDMDLEQLPDLADTLESDEAAVSHASYQLTSRLHYLMYSQTRELKHLDVAIDRAQNAVELPSGDDKFPVQYESRLRSLIVLLLKRYEASHMLDDLDTAILRASELVILTEPEHVDRQARVKALFDLKLKRYKHTGLADDYEDALRTLTETIDAATRAMLASGESQQWFKKWEATRDLSKLDMAVLRAEEAVRDTPDDYDYRADRIANAANFLTERFKQTNNMADMRLACQRAQESILALPHEFILYEDRPVVLHNAANTFFAMFQASKEIEYMQRAVHAGEDAVRLCSPYGDAARRDRAMWLGDLVAYLHAKSTVTKSMEDLSVAIARGEEALSVTSRGSSGKIGILNNLANALASRFEATNTINDQDRQIEYLKEAGVVTPIDHPQRADILSNLALALYSRYRRAKRPEDISLAIQSSKDAVDALTPFLRDRARHLGNLSALYAARFEEAGNLDDIHSAISKGEDCLNSGILLDLEAKANVLNTLGVAFRLKFERSGDLSDLRHAVKRGREAESTMPETSPNRPSVLGNLATTLSLMAKHTGHMNDLHLAISIAEDAVAKQPQGHPDRAGLLNNLATSLQTKFDATEDLNDLHAAIVRVQEAVAITGSNHPDRARWLCNLCAYLKVRSERTGSLEDLDLAVGKGEEALQDMTGPGRSFVLCNLAGSFLARNRRTGSRSDADMAVQRFEEAIETAPDDHTQKATLLSNLSLAYRTRFEQSSEPEDLQTAIAKGEEGLKAASQSSPNIAILLSNLAVSYRTKFEDSRNLIDLDMAITRGKDALEATPHDHPDRARWLNNLGGFHFTRYKLLSSSEDSVEALALWTTGVHLSNSPPRERIKAALHAAEILVDEERWTEASQITELAVRLFPSLAPRHLLQDDQQHILAEFTGLAALSASVALEAGKDAAHAVQLLELGRGIITGLRLGSRSDLSELRKLDEGKEKADRFERLRYIMDSSGPSDLLDHTGTTDPNRRHDATQALENVVREIRELPGFEDFSGPLPISKIMDAASLGPVVIINVSLCRSDALIVLRGAIRSIRLPDLYEADLLPRRRDGKDNPSLRPWFLARQGTRAGRVARKSSEHDGFRSFLKRLWSHCVRPVLEDLGFVGGGSPEEIQGTKDTVTVGREEPLPRIWWIGTGAASSLPFHAAGDHSRDSVENTMSRAISSYTPTLRALRHAREKEVASEDVDGGNKDKGYSLLLVKMATTPGLSDLPGVNAEEAYIREVVTPPHSLQLLSQPDAEAVLGKLKDYSIAHFACHGASDMVDPSASFLALQKKHPPGDGAPTSDRLTVQQISDMNLGKGWLAYLSACSTAENRVSALADETLHLAAGFQVAGFAHVIASMWPSNDAICARVARVFYRRLLSDDMAGKGVKSRVAEALHMAVCEIRAQNRDQPHLWAQYIHTGA